jgi:hypothetical protein
MGVLRCAITGKKDNVIIKKGMCAGIPHTHVLLLLQIIGLKKERRKRWDNRRGKGKSIGGIIKKEAGEREEEEEEEKGRS